MAVLPCGACSGSFDSLDTCYFDGLGYSVMFIALSVIEVVTLLLAAAVVTAAVAVAAADPLKASALQEAN